jgi:hypothetical protein
LLTVNLPDDIVYYYKKTFIGIYDNNIIITTPRFSFNFWIHFERDLANLPLTNNNIEGFQNFFND